VSCTGVHGANRLASNSLLEGLVFGARAGAAAVEDSRQPSVVSRQLSNTQHSALSTQHFSDIATAVRKRVKRVMWERVGILRDKDSLQRALQEFSQIKQANLSVSSRNFVTLAALVAAAALWREESRGGHFRTDFPERDEKWRVHSIQKTGAQISSDPKINFTAAEFLTRGNKAK
ncbi:MAG TPA: hypothetical protein VK400_03545, partial [Pyrinomonadaceae bacterium]|nr:hypothetical protein [Pyrinomonadaceae bacterium]